MGLHARTWFTPKQRAELRSVGGAVNAWPISAALLSGGTKAASIGCWRSVEGSLHCRGGELREL